VRLMWVSVLLLLAACAAGEPVRVTVARGSSARDLTLLLSSSDSNATIRGVRVQATLFDASQVETNANRTVWSLAPSGAPDGRVPAAIRYGIAPPGFVGSRAEGLVPGRYVVEVLRDGPSNVAFFEIQTSGLASP
jgi:hypothetical protein